MKPSIIILIDDNPTTLFYNEDVINDVYKNTKILSYEKSELFLKDYIDLKFKDEKQILVFLDINMPEYSGFELLEEIEEEIEDLDNLSVIMLTSSKMKSDTEKATRFTNVIGYIEKPVSEERIKEVLVK